MAAPDRRVYLCTRPPSGPRVMHMDDPDTMARTRIRALEPRLDLFNHSPSGFEWGYGGSGPAQLALALLADVLDDDEQALRLHQTFKAAVVAPAEPEWQITAAEIRAWVDGAPTETCPTCDGDGEISCDECGGEGETLTECGECDGCGQIRGKECEECGGECDVIAECAECDGYAVVCCDLCDGAGRVRHPSMEAAADL